jgi:glycerol kinase
MKRPRYLLSLDQGTTSSRAIVFDDEGVQIASSQRPIHPTFPHPGWVNQDASQLWLATLTTAREVLTNVGLQGNEIAGIGIANQRETLIVWDRRSGEPVAPAIVWQSRQSQAQVEDLIRRGVGPFYQRITGLFPDAYFTATKIAWLLAEDNEFRRQARDGDVLAGTVDSWLVWNLTGGTRHLTDVSNASRTMLFDIQALDWSDTLLRDLDIPRQILPTVVPSAGDLACTQPTLFGAEISIAGVAGDQQAALFGQTCFAPGEAKNTYGTGAFLLMNTGPQPKRSTHRLLTTIAWQIGGDVAYALEGSVFVSGAAVAWLRDGLGIIGNAADVEALAMNVPDADGVVLVPAFTGLGAPYWDSDARGTIVGLTRGSTAAHLARATLDAIAFQTRDVTDAMSVDAQLPLAGLRVDGGASRNDLLMQIQANVLGVPVMRPKNTEATAVGAAFLAGLGCGLWNDQSELSARWEPDRVFEPVMSQDERDSQYERWKRAVERARDWA